MEGPTGPAAESRGVAARASPGPGHVVTFLLTDLEGSTRLWEERPAEAGALLDRHDEVIREAVTRHGGEHIKSRGEGDSTFNVFDSVAAAALAALDIQRALEAEAWPVGVRLRVRAALNTGEAEFHSGDYLGTAVNRCARLRSIGHGGQILLSAVTADLIRDQLPDGAGLRALGAHRLKDLSRPETVFQLEHPDLAGEFPPLRSMEPHLHNLPAQRTPLVGRTAVFDRVSRLMADSRLLTLTGVGGCGKTRLAVEAAARDQPRFPDGIFFVDLAVVSDPAVVWTALATAVTAVTGGFQGSSRPVREDLLGFFQDQNVLVVVDNCEHLIDACAELVDSLLGRCPGVSVLATSREAFGIEGEQVFTVPSLDLPEESEAQSSESVMLFVARATAARAVFRLTDDNLASVVEICRRLDGIPLAIELAAAQVAHLAPEQIAERLHQRFSLLVGTRRRVQRQQTLKAAMDWSYDLLSAPERVLLRRLAVFPASFDLAALEAICEPNGTPNALIGSLVARSLVGVIESSPQVRYRLLETVRIYAEELLTQAGESQRYRARHRDHYLDAVLNVPMHSALWFAEASPLFAEFDNLRAALDWSGEEGRYDHIGQILLRAGGLWNWTGAHEEARRWLDLALEHEETLEPDQRVELLAASNMTTLALLDPDRIRFWARDHEWEGSTAAKCCIALGLFVESSYATVFDPPSAVEISRSRLELAERDLPGFWPGMLLMGLGDALITLGDLDGALGSYREASRKINEVGFLWAWSAMEESMALHLQGAHEGALRAARRAEELMPQITLPVFQTGAFGEAMMGGPLALATAGVGQRAEAEEMVVTLIERVQRANVPGIFELCIGYVGCIAALGGEYERASCLLAAGPMFRSPGTHAIYRHYVRLVRDHLDAETVRSCRERGSSMSRDEAIAFALRGTT